MPTYDYECEGPQRHRFEQFQRFSDPPVSDCPECGSGVHRVIHAVGVLFKGPGFYKTDNAPKAAASSANGDSNESETASDKTADEASKPTETKPKETKAAAPAASAAKE